MDVRFIPFSCVFFGLLLVGSDLCCGFSRISLRACLYIRTPASVMVSLISFTSYMLWEICSKFHRGRVYEF